MKQNTPVVETYTTPAIATGSEWFLWFRFYHAGKWHVKKEKAGLNRITNLKERKRQFEALLEVRKEWLAAGWNPILDSDFKTRNITSALN